MSGGLTIPGLACEVCGAAELMIVVPGTLGERNDVVGRVTRDVSHRAWCSFDHARQAGWPWIESERRVRRAGRHG